MLAWDTADVMSSLIIGIKDILYLSQRIIAVQYIIDEQENQSFDPVIFNALKSQVYDVWTSMPGQTSKNSNKLNHNID
jgi:hypothetical protein